MGLGASPSSVSSPTFTLIHEYRGRLRLIHADLYRLRSERDAESIGLEDYFDQSTVAAVEWADRCPALLPGDHLEIEIAHRTARSRTIRFRAAGNASARLLADLKAELSKNRPTRRLKAAASARRGGKPPL